MGNKLPVGKVIKMPCMRSGVCQYLDEKVLVTKAALDSMAASAQGIPVIIDHPDRLVTGETISQLPIVGRVADLHYIEHDELWYAHFVVDDDEAVELLTNGYGVSTAWIPDKYAGGGTYNNVPYDREVIEAHYEHLAIVKTPRYEMAVGPIFINAKDGQEAKDATKIIYENKGSNSMIGKIWKNIIRREEVVANSNEEFSIEVDGKEMPLKDAIGLVVSAKKNEAEAKEKDKEEEKKMVNGDDEIDVDGKKMTVKELIEAYLATKKTASADDKDDKDDEKDSKENAEGDKEDDKEDKKEEKKEAKKNSVDAEDPDEEKLMIARYNALDQAYRNGAAAVEPAQFMSLRERTDLGRKLYGSK